MVNKEGFYKKAVNQGSSKVAAPSAQNAQPKGPGFQSGTKMKQDPMQLKPKKMGK